MDSNHRPLPCQGSALTRLSYGPASRWAECILSSRNAQSSPRAQHLGTVFARPAYLSSGRNHIPQGAIFGLRNYAAWMEIEMPVQKLRRGCLLCVIIAALLAFSACSVSVNKNGSDDNKNVDIKTPGVGV